MQGNSGPHAGHPGTGVPLTGLAGFYEVLGWPDRTPVSGYGAYTDFIGPSLTVCAIASALANRHKTSKGTYLEVSQLEAGLFMLQPAILDYVVNGRVAGRMGNRSPDATPYGVYRCKGEERWCAIAVCSEEEWQILCKVMSNPEWSRSPRFESVGGRKENEDELDKLVEEWTVGFSPEEIMHTLQKAGVGAGVVNTPADLFSDPQFKHRKYFRLLKHSEIGEHYYESYGFQLSKTPSRFEMAAPCLGEHTEYVCRELLGMSDEDFVELLADNLFE